MKSIILFRHSESMWPTNAGDDHSRPLSEYGIKIAKRMGLYLADKGSPDLVISSTAIRANTTADLAMDSGKWGCSIILERRIYGGSPKLLLDLINKQNDKFSSICLVGHEPNFSRFIIETTCSSYIYFPTASMAKIDFEVQSFSEIEFNIGTLDWVIKPKDLNI